MKTCDVLDELTADAAVDIQSADDEFETAIQSSMSTSVDGSVCIGSTTGELLGFTARLDDARKSIAPTKAMPMMCFWGAFVK